MLVSVLKQSLVEGVRAGAGPLTIDAFGSLSKSLLSSVDVASSSLGSIQIMNILKRSFTFKPLAESHNDATPQPKFERRTKTSVPAPGKATPSQRNNLISRQERAMRKQESLLNVRGIGKKNLHLLEGHGIGTVSELKRLYMAQQRDQEAYVKYLQEVVGIRNRGHCQSILAHVDELTSAESHPPVTVSVEGNISVGKSTFLSYIREGRPELQGALAVVPEPVDQWQNLKGIHADQTFNMLDEFYNNPERYAYTFQNYVFITRMMQERNSYNQPEPYRMLERSIFSDRMVFVRAVHQAKWLTDLELAVYDSWFDPMLMNVPSLKPDGFVYLRATPGTCMRRLKSRARSEETSVDLDYLTKLHGLHEDWLAPEYSLKFVDQLLPASELAAAARNPQFMGPSFQGGSESLFNNGHTPLDRRQLRLNGQTLSHSPPRDGCVLKLTDWDYCSIPAPPKVLEDCLYLVDGKRCPVDSVNGSLDKVPALVLNCDNDFDVHQDQDAKQDLANKVFEYYNYLTHLQVVRQQRSKLFGENGRDPGPTRGITITSTQKSTTLLEISPAPVSASSNLSVSPSHAEPELRQPVAA